MKRQRGRGRGNNNRPGGGQHNQQHPNRQMESNGPDVKVRGPASHIHERYLQLARDAASSGDRVLSENYLQYADHYFRVWRAMQPAVPVQPQRFENDQDFDGEDDSGEGGEAEAEAGEAGGDAEDAGEQREADGQPRQQGFERDGERGARRRRGRRERFRPEGESDGEAPAAAREEGDSEAPRRRERDEGEERPRRERREPREPRAEREAGESREGFAGPGPKPAFLGND